eukprot:gene4566-7950_t
MYSKSTTKIPDIVKYGLLKVGDVLYFQGHEAIINSDGKLEFKISGNIFSSSSFITLHGNTSRRGWGLNNNHSIFLVDRVHTADGVSLKKLRTETETQSAKGNFDKQQPTKIKKQRKYATIFANELQKNLSYAEIETLNLERIFNSK